jgi:peptidylprolyl isomerase
MRWITLLLAMTLSTFAENTMTKSTTVVLETTLGNIELTLKPDVAPKACENFIGHVQSGYYNGIIFHRVIKDFMAQGGDPTGTGAGGTSIWKKEFQDECTASVKFDRKGLLAMANRGPNTNGSQFFITTAATPWLNGKHTIFGEVTSGKEVMDKINSAKTAPGDRPSPEIKIVKAYVK